MALRTAKPAAKPAASETRLADVTTVGWMLTVITALLCETGLVGVRLLEHYQQDVEAIGFLGDLLLFAALVFGLRAAKTALDAARAGVA